MWSAKSTRGKTPSLRGDVGSKYGLLQTVSAASKTRDLFVEDFYSTRTARRVSSSSWATFTLTVHSDVREILYTCLSVSRPCMGILGPALSTSPWRVLTG